MPSARGYDGDGGVSRRMAGQFMTQMQDIKEDIFWVFTANGVENLHEAFLADDRVDCVLYMHMPGPAQRADGWRMYLQRYFPATVSVPGKKPKKFTCYLDNDFERVHSALVAAHAEAADTDERFDYGAWADRLVAALMCLHGDERAAKLDRVAGMSPELRQLVSDRLIDDAGWTHARIKSCCRLARKRQRSLTEIARTMPRHQQNLQKAIDRLERWAADEAIDAETGAAYRPTEEREAASATKAKTTGGMRRKVRTLKED